MKHSKVWLWVAVLIAMFMLSACGGGSSNPDTNTTASGNQWDTMQWDQGKWN